MKTIPLSKGKVALVDDDDYERIAKFKWWINSHGYAARTVWYGRNHAPQHRNFSMHREILGVTDRRREVDHRNENRLDNRKSNLRICDHNQNSSNRGAPRSNKSGYKGVVKHPQSQGWIAQITVKGKNHYLGHFSTPQLAAAAYNKVAAKSFGDYAKLNEIHHV
jgi:hypothetical protein